MVDKRLDPVTLDAPCQRLVVRHALRALNSQPETTWMIGDNLESDIAPALALGMHSVWVDAEGQGLAADAAIRPDRVVQAISELV